MQKLLAQHAAGVRMCVQCAEKSPWCSTLACTCSCKAPGTDARVWVSPAMAHYAHTYNQNDSSTAVNRASSESSLESIPCHKKEGRKEDQPFCLHLHTLTRTCQLVQHVQERTGMKLRSKKPCTAATKWLQKHQRASAVHWCNQAVMQIAPSQTAKCDLLQ